MHTLSELLRAEPFEAAPVRARLQTLGFADVARAEKLLDSLAKTGDEREALWPVLDALSEDLGRSSEPERALLNFSRLCDSVLDRRAFFHALHERPGVRARLARLLSFSQALSDLLVRRPELLDALRVAPRASSRAELRHLARVACGTEGTSEAKLDALRRFRRAQTLRIGLLDMELKTWRDAGDFALVTRQISDLAQVCVQEALRLVAREIVGQDELEGFGVIGMGKLGARELNYSSDIDLIFLGEGDGDLALKIGTRLLKALGDSSHEGALFRVDMRLRPDGTSGALVTPFGYALAYYESYAGAWEWQALIKARGLAGDARLLRRFRKFTRGVTWAKRPDDAHLREMLGMKKRSETTSEGRDARNVKSGPGGIRDAEWVVQQEQMMVGPSHARARAASTLRAVSQLRAFQALTPEEAANLQYGYLFLRVLEHRLQLLDERAIRQIPDDTPALAALARRMGCPWSGTAAAKWLRETHAEHRSVVRALCEKLFWGWTAADETQATENGVALSGSQAQRLERLAGGTPNHPLPAPLARQIRAALPGALQSVEHAADPERAIANLERLCDASGNRLSLLRALGSEPRLGRAVLTLLGGAQAQSETLIHFPELLDLAANRPLLARARGGEEARAECRTYCFAFRDQKAAVRRWKRREMLRIGLRDLVLDVSPHEITSEIADLAQACLQVAHEATMAELRPSSSSIAPAILGMGKLGGGEMHYASDADVIFVYESLGNDEGAAGLAARWAEGLGHFLHDRTEEGTAFEVDARLRPNGKSGALCPSVQGFLDYFERPGGLAVWERQALTRARYIAGDRATSARLQAAIRHVAFPDEWQTSWGDELRHIKHRVETERANKGVKARGEVFDVKLGRGALSDIEFCAQWLSLKHGAQHPDLQTPNTRRQLEAARDANVLSAEEARVLLEAHTFLRRAELRLQITQERASGAVRHSTPEFAAWARAVYPDETTANAAERFANQWQRHSQEVRPIVERVRDEL